MYNNKLIPKVIYANLYLNKDVILKENKNKSGIYRINNIKTGKIYIGSSVNLARRFTIYYSEKAMLSKLRTSTSIIYSAIIKHGHNDFSLEILEYCDINVLIEREQYYIDLLKPKYNILKIANSRLGSKQSEATKTKISESLKALNRISKSRVITRETKLKMSLNTHGVRVKVFDTSNNFINDYPTMTSLAKHFGVNIRTISRYLDNNKSYNGFIFKTLNNTK